MTWGRKRPLCLFLAAMGGLWFSQEPAMAAGKTLEQEMIDGVRGLQRGTLNQEDVTGRCIEAIEGSEKETDFREVTTTYLDVPPEDAIASLCRALVQSIVSGSITENHLKPVITGWPKNREAFEAGRVLRAIYFAHFNGTPPANRTGGAQ